MFQDWLLRFVENYDEPRVVLLFDVGRIEVVVVVTLMQIGVKLVHYG